VTGYNVYRAAISAGPYTIVNQYPLNEAEYIDTAVESGGTYYYVTTALDSDGNESSFSNEAAVTAP
jgi:fibronectin type 3 domain-containing protein